MANSLWPNLASETLPRDMLTMLRDAAGDIDKQTNDEIDLYIDIVGVGSSTGVRDVRYNCYLRVVKKVYLHLLFQVTTPVGKPFPAKVATPEGDVYPASHNEAELRQVISDILHREATKEAVLYLRSIA